MTLAHEIGTVAELAAVDPTRDVWVCSCPRCRDTVCTVAAVRPETRFVVKGETGRPAIGAADLVAALTVNGPGPDLDQWARDHGAGYIREVFVMAADLPALVAAAGRHVRLSGAGPAIGDDQADYGGTVDGMGHVFSDADPGL